MRRPGTRWLSGTFIRPTPAAQREPGITCETYTRGEGKRCIHYAANGACALSDEFLCHEWLKANVLKHARSLPVVTEPPKPAPPACDRFGNPSSRGRVETGNAEALDAS